MARFIPQNVLVSWCGDVLGARRATRPLKLSELVPGAAEVFVLSPNGALLAPDGWTREDEETIRRGDLAIVASHDAPVARARRGRAGVLAGAIALAGILHGAGATFAALSTPGDTDAERMELMRHYLSASAERDEGAQELAMNEDREELRASLEEGGSGTRAKGEDGTMGNPAAFGGSRYGVAGPSDGAGSAKSDEDPDRLERRLERASAMREASTFGMIGTLAAGEGGGGRGAGFGSGHGRLGGAAHHAPSSEWGSSIDDSFGSGGLGLSGAGAGGGGAGWQQQANSVGAGEWDDNANYREFAKFVTAAKIGGLRALDVRDRQFLVARDVAGKPLASCDVTVVDAQGNATTLRTMATGRALFFPHAEKLTGTAFTAYARCGGNAMSAPFTLAEDGVVELRGKEPRAEEGFTVDVGFALDTTGSMGEEIDAVKATLRKVAQSLEGVSLRVGLVEYKDKGDEFVTRVYPMEADVAHFAGAVSALRASGGGDMPEAMAQGFHDALTRLEWRPRASARLLFVIGDAPPHLDAQDGPDYADDARLAAHQGVQVHGIAASGMDAAGQVVFRQISQYSGGTEMFVLRGGAGPQSTGGGDPLASCGGTQQQYRSGNLAELVIGKVTAARRALDANPTTIAGRGKDESAKPCNERVAMR